MTPPHRCLAFPALMVGLLVLALVVMAVTPMGAVRQCRDAYAAAREAGR